MIVALEIASTTALEAAAAAAVPQVHSIIAYMMFGFVVGEFEAFGQSRLRFPVELTLQGS